MGTWLWSRTGAVNKPNWPASSLRVQTSVDGRPRAIIYGCARVSTNLLWYGLFFSVPSSQGSGGGKGGGGKGGGSGGSGSVSSYNYFASIAYGLGEGPLGYATNIFMNKSAYAPFQASSQFNMDFIAGTYPQAVPAILASFAPANNQLNYAGEAMQITLDQPLGTAPDTPNVSCVVVSQISGGFPGSLDTLPQPIIYDIMTNPFYGVGLPPSRIPLAAWAAFNTYTIATNLTMSLVVADQRPLADYLKTMMQGVNSEFFWSGGQLQIATYGDAQITANGVTFVPNVTPIYSLTDNDFLPGPNTDSDAPIICSIKRLEDVYNSVSVEYIAGDVSLIALGGANIPFIWNQNVGGGTYEVAIVTAKDDSLINSYGLKQDSTRQHHEFACSAAAQMSAALQLGREQVINTFQFRLSQRHILIDPMDLLEITETNTGMLNVVVRVKEITENNDGSLDFVCEEWLGGVANAPVYGSMAKAGNHQDYNANPGGINAPLIWEPTNELGDGLYIWMGITPQNLTNWGGCEVWVSNGGDVNSNYVKVGERAGASNAGIVTAPLAQFTQVPTIGATIDNTSTLAVDMSESETNLASGTLTDLLAGNLLLYVDNPPEYIGYQTATPVSTTAFTASLTGLNRGLYGSSNTAHSTSPTANVILINQNVFRYAYNQQVIGQRIYFKFPSFNQFGAARQGLADVGSFIFTPTGAALSQPPPVVTNFMSQSIGNQGYLTWTQVSFNLPFPVYYEIRKGSTWSAGIPIGRFVHPPVPAPGDDLYWIEAVYNPVQGTTIYSSAPSLVNSFVGGAGNVTGSAFQGSNPTSTGTITTINESAAGWPGASLAFQGLGGNPSVCVDSIGLRVGPAHLSSGAIQPVKGFYQISSVVNFGAVKNVLVGINYTGYGAPFGSTEFFNWSISGAVGGVTKGSGYSTGFYTGIPLSNFSGLPSGAVANVAVGFDFTALTTNAVIAVQPTLFGTTIINNDTLFVSSTAGVGPGTGAKFTVKTDKFGQSDIFDTFPSAYANVTPLIAVSTIASGGFSTFAPWSPGIYRAWQLNFRLQVQSADPDVICYSTQFIINCYTT